jgi:purine-binding chemotaxis protein CheW
MARDYLLIRLDDRLLGLPLAEVSEVLRAVHVTPIPEAPDTVLGAINVRGEWRVVLNLRKRFGLPDTPISPRERLILVDGEPFCFPADSVDGLVEVTERALEAANDLGAGIERYCKGMAEHQGETALLFDHASLFGEASWREGVRQALHAIAQN